VAVAKLHKKTATETGQSTILMKITITQNTLK